MKGIHLSLKQLLHPSKSSLLIGFALLVLTGCSSPQPVSVFDQIIQQIAQQERAYVNLETTDAQTSKWLELVTDSGAFRDIDYSKRSQTAWEPLKHLQRMKDMVLSYVTPNSQYYGEVPLHSTLLQMLAYWHKAYPKSTNWWYREIGYPQLMGLNLTLLRIGKEPVPQELEDQILNRMKKLSKGPDQKGSQGTGANKMDIALQWIYRTCLQEDSVGLQFAVDQFFYPIRFNEKQGIQSDYSYCQHGHQLYTGGYGAAVLNAFLKVAFYLKGTSYEQPEKTDLMSKFVRYGYLPTIRGQYMMYNVRGRRPFADGFSGAFVSSLQKMSVLDTDHTDTYSAAMERVSGRADASYDVQPAHLHFWRSDYTLHQRPSFTMDVRMASIRSARCENGNGDNLKGYFLTEGGTQIVRRGDEYQDVGKAWDWAHIPGTTTPAVDSIPLPHPWETPGQSTFCGGVSDGLYGVTAYHLIDHHFNIHTEGRKAWFFFDKEVVCMGSDIQSKNPHPIHTTVNQCLLRGEVSLLEKGQNQPHTLAAGETSSNQLLCVHHDSISYYFPEGGKISVRGGLQEGNLKSLSSYSPDTLIQREVFKLWMDHGVRPQQGSYLYYVIPHTGSAMEATQVMDELTVVNTPKVQAVYNRSQHQLGVIFHEKGELSIEGQKVSSNQPCVALFTQLDTPKIKAHLADATYQLPSATLTMEFPSLKKKQIVECHFQTDVHQAGSTHSYLLTEKGARPLSSITES